MDQPGWDAGTWLDRAAAGVALVDRSGMVVRANAGLCALVGRPAAAVLHQELLALHPETEHTRIGTALLGARAATAEIPQVSAELHSGGGVVPVLLTLAPLAEDDRAQQLVLVHVRPCHGDDLADGRTARTAARAARFLGLACQAETLPWARLASEAAGVVQLAVGAGQIAVFEQVPDGSGPRLRAALGWDTERDGLDRFLAALQLTPTETGDGTHVAVDGAGREPCQVPPGTADMTVAVVASGGQGQAVGVVAVHTGQGCGFTERDRRFVRDVAELLAVARQEPTDSSSPERRHADEHAALNAALHEGPLQNLSVLSLRLEQARMQLAQGRTEDTERLLGKLQDDMGTEIAGLRQLMSRLHTNV